ncbi:DUF3800 domain-containing protein [Anaerolineae bacterium CFX9]|nr:DUF3800 domain-containing protein [Anaerolineae bacterium CFX9]
MYLCYIDESGTSDIPGNTSHFVLAGLSIPVSQWRSCDQQITEIKTHYGLTSSEIHVGWILRPYLEQARIPEFQRLSYDDRVFEVERLRRQEIYRLRKLKNPKSLKQTKKNFDKTAAYIHLTFEERKQFIGDIASRIRSWSDARLFAECIDKTYFDPKKTGKNADEQAFEQLVSRFQLYLMNESPQVSNFGLLIHDNNFTVAKKHTELMKQYLANGTLWTQIDRIVETPLFVDSQLTSMVQIADLCAYALRRYLENDETELFDQIYSRAHRRNNAVVGVRHFSSPKCSCRICESRRQT